MVHLLRYSIIFLFTCSLGIIRADTEWANPVPLTEKDGMQIQSISNFYNNEPQIAIGDWDNDEDLDLILFEVIEGPSFLKNTMEYRFSYYENSGTLQNYSFENKGELKGIKVRNMSSYCIARGLQIVDVDNDGWKDLTFVDVEKYLHHANCFKGDGSLTLEKDTRFFTQKNAIGIGAVSMFEDNDRDGDKDLFWISVEKYANGVMGSYFEYFQNLSNDSKWEFKDSPQSVFDYESNNPMVFKRDQLKVLNGSLHDFDNDGDSELLVWTKEYSKNISIGVGAIYENYGSYKFGIKDTLIREKDVYTTGTAGDLNNDGILDILILKGKKLFIAWGKGITGVKTTKNILSTSRPFIKNNTLILPDNLKDGNKKLIILSACGREIGNYKVSSMRTDLSKLTYLSKGVYFVTVNLSNQKHTVVWNKI